MGVAKTYFRTIALGGVTETVQALTGASTATTIKSFGVTSIFSTAGGTAGQHAFKMASPEVGITKTLVVDVGSTREVKVQVGATTAVTIFGTTHNNVTFSTGAGRYRNLSLVGLSATQWAVVSRSTGVTLSA
jgi:hypothetical protein